MLRRFAVLVGLAMVASALNAAPKSAADKDWVLREDRADPTIQSVQVTYPGEIPTLHIRGTGFSGGPVKVRLGGVLLPSGAVTVNSATSLTVAAALD